MASVSIHPPRTPVTSGSNGIAAATVPNVCKMPGPPAPFVPTPLPNIGRSTLSPKGYSTSVKIEGQTVAIKGASFGSMGDIASKGTGGGMISCNVEGPTKFIAPGSLTVHIEGKNVHLLSDVMSNNNGPSGSPPNAATMAGLAQAIGLKGDELNPEELDCGEVGEYGEQKKRSGKNAYDRDHIPSKAALKEAAVKLNGGAKLTTAQTKAVENLAISVVIPKAAHKDVSPTFTWKNQPELIKSDAKNLQKAAQRDTAAMRKGLDKYADEDCVEAYKAAADKIDAIDNKTYDAFLKDCLKAE